MIFRRRRTRIELEQTTVKMKAGGAISAAARPVVVTPTAPSPVESVLARVLPFPAPEPNDHLPAEIIGTSDTINAHTAKETRS
jgi:hypothetical protein